LRVGTGRIPFQAPDIDVRIETGFHKLNRSRFLAENLDVAIRLDPFDYSDLKSEHLFDEYLDPHHSVPARAAWSETSFHLDVVCSWKRSEERASNARMKCSTSVGHSSSLWSRRFYRALSHALTRYFNNRIPLFKKIRDDSL
jgi:DNA-binding transcriptional LysR family regulator